MDRHSGRTPDNNRNSPRRPSPRTVPGRGGPPSDTTPVHLGRVERNHFVRPREIYDVTMSRTAIVIPDWSVGSAVQSRETFASDAITARAPSVNSDKPSSGVQPIGPRRVYRRFDGSFGARPDSRKSIRRAILHIAGGPSARVEQQPAPEPYRGNPRRRRPCAKRFQ